MADPIDDPARRDFLATAAAALAAACLPASTSAATMAPGPLDEASLADLAGRLGSGATTAQALAAAYLERIEAIDRAGPMLRSVIEVNPYALELAEALDRERAAGRVRGPLHGLPVLLKDNIATGDRMSTSAGSLALDGVRAPEDAPLVRRLRAAGVLVLGKTNLSEWANFRSTHSISGWSSRGGQTRNPYAAGRTPSGSSSGSAVAAAANLCAAAIGTETDGSITSPSSCNNLVGLKPSLGLVSRTGIIPIGHTQDTAGPMARSVRDCALLMNALAGADPEDAITVRAPQGIDFTAFVDRRDLKGVRLGVIRQCFGANEKVDAVIEEALLALKALGAELVDVRIATHGKYEALEFEALFHEFKAGIDAFLPKYLPGAPVRSLADLIEYNTWNARRVMPHFGQDVFLKAQGKGPLSSAAYRNARARSRRMARELGIDAAVAKHKLDALVAPTSSAPWLIDTVNGDTPRGGCTSLAAVSGYPHLTVPAGFVAGTLPVGLSFIGTAFGDAKLLGLGAAFEAATHHRRAPPLGNA